VNPESTSSSDDGEPRLSWRERELLTALRRVANSRAQVQALDEATQRHASGPAPLPGDVERVDELERELAKVRAKASSRFGGGAARDRLPHLEAQQRIVLERLGFDSYDAFVAAGRRPPSAAEPVDPAIVDFAHRELEAAEAAYAELLSMPDDVDDAPAAPLFPYKRDPGSTGSDATGPGEGEPATIDLTGNEGAGR
jgi:hypothetical protein